MYRRLFEIRQVDGHLCQVARFQLDPHRLHIPQPARRKPDRFRDFVRDADIGGIEIHVVGNQEFPCAHHGYPGRGVQLRFANIRLTVVVLFKLFAQPFELPAPHVFKIYALRPCRRRFVKKYRYPVTLPDFVAHQPRQRHAILDGHTIDGNKRQHVRRAHAWMRTFVFRQVDQLHGLAGAQKRRFRHRVWFARQRDHRAVMVGVHLSIQHVHTRHAAHRRHDGINLRGVAPFGKIWHALNQSFHRFGFLSGRPGQLFGSFGFLSGSVGRSYRNAGLFVLLGVPGACPAGAGVCAGFVGTCAGLTSLFTDFAAPGKVFSGHCGPIIGFMLGGSGCFIICVGAWTACLDFSVEPGLARSFR